jgi:membrane-associated protease RseP (regulator of RpoE activity)
MRALAVALLLSVSLSAGDKSPLEKAVGLFRSPDAGTRAAGSQLAEREVRQLLAPLLEALKDEDPEVRRRARRSILSLVPGEAERDEKAQKPVRVVIGLAGGVGQAFRGRLGRRVIKVVLARSEPLQPTQKQRAELSRIGRRLLRGLGVHWRTQWKAPLMPGFSVHAVKQDGAAARLGLRKGDLIVRINGVEVAGMRGGPEAVDWGRATVTVYRKGRYVRLPRT